MMTIDIIIIEQIQYFFDTKQQFIVLMHKDNIEADHIQVLKDQLQHKRAATKDISRFTLDFSDSDSQQDNKQSNHENVENIRSLPTKIGFQQINCESSGRLCRLKKCKDIRNAKSHTNLNKNRKQIYQNPQDYEQIANTSKKQVQNLKNPDQQQYEEVIQLKASTKINRLGNKQKNPNFFRQKTQINSKCQSLQKQKKQQQKITKQKQTKKSQKFFIYQSQSDQEYQEKQENIADNGLDNIIQNISYLCSNKNQQISSQTFQNRLFQQQEQPNTSVISNNLDDQATTHEQNTINIYRVNSQIEQISLQIMGKINNIQDFQTMKLFLNSPTPQSIVFRFQIHKYKYLMKTQYQLWMDYGYGMKICAIATNNSIFGVDKTVYDIKVPLKAQSKTYSNFIIAKLASDFKREIFTCYSGWVDGKPLKNCKILCSVVNQPNYFGIVVQDLYIPSVNNNGQLTINCTKMGKDLKKLSKLPELKNQIKKLRTYKIPERQISKLKQVSKICTQTTRNGVIKTEDQQNIFTILKIQKNRFKVAVVHPISPLQVFCYAIVHQQ